MGILTIFNIATSALTSLLGSIPELIAIKNAIKTSPTASNFDVEIKAIEDDTIQTTGDVDTDVANWLAAHPATAN